MLKYPGLGQTKITIFRFRSCFRESVVHYISVTGTYEFSIVGMLACGVIAVFAKSTKYTRIYVVFMVES